MAVLMGQPLDRSSAKYRLELACPFLHLAKVDGLSSDLLALLQQFPSLTVLVSRSQTAFSSFIFGREGKGSGERPI